jgi:putative endopeptidase
LNNLIGELPLENFKNYLRFHVIDDDADYLPHDFTDAKFNFNKLLTGQTVMQERWKRMTTMVDQQMGDNLADLCRKIFYCHG